ncbi:hypothetical protein [Jongsikchunia kroppenstedtii]|uniref:hypothetical protein n=1 Tax=Jongsikchunia kroppenstedtii TaxID=1121721 RepID=UPI000367B47E|nr:hypothetical protein [Jongsikchunia kroppenstedtii]
MIAVLIAVCEIGFWVTLVAGLIARYLLRRPKLGAALLIAAPAIDLFLLICVAVDLFNGGTASWQHGLAAIYIAFSVAYGPQIVAWADIRFVHRFAGGPAPQRLSGTAYTLKCWKDVLRTLLMAAIASGISGGLIVLVDDTERTRELTTNFRIVGIILVVDVLWAVSYTIWPKKDRAEPRTPASLS